MNVEKNVKTTKNKQPEEWVFKLLKKYMHDEVDLCGDFEFARSMFLLMFKKRTGESFDPKWEVSQ